MTALIIVIFVLSGFAGLSYQLVWMKHLMLIFGVSHAAISTVVAAFMAGLAIGSIVLGRAADRVRHPLRLYALLEIGIGVSAAALPSLLSLVNTAYVSMARSTPGHSWEFSAIRFLLCFGVLLVPTTLMGGTLPAMGRHFIRHAEKVGLGAGLLYGANTVGGILGAATTGFVLLGTLGAHRTSMLAVGLNFLAAALAGLISLRTAPVAPEESTPIEVGEGIPSGRRRWLPTFVLLAFGVAGATSLAYEVLWTRVLIYFMDLTIYSFTTILVTFLTGLAVGAVVFARVADRMRNLLALFGFMQLLIAVSALYTLHALGLLFSVATTVGPALSGSPATGVLIGRFAAAAVFILLPTTIMGGAFPVITKLYTRDLKALGRSLGNLYGANTVGCVIGSLGAGFVLLRWTGAQQAIGLVALINGALGVSVLLLSGMRRTALVAAVAAGVLGIGFKLVARVPPTVMRSRRVASGDFRLLYYDEGAEASLAVLQNGFGSREININGLSTAYSDYGDILSHKLLAHPPALLTQEMKSVLIVGLGMGSTAWSFAQYPVERIDCVELVPAERETAKLFLPENGGVLSDPRFNLIIGDGRNHLLTTSRKYDVISFNAIHPAFSPYLYTREFYELCKSRLTETGVICAWVPTNSEYFPSLLRTFQEVFPHTSLWVANMGHLSLVGTPERQTFDFEWIQNQLSAPGVKENLAETHLERPFSLLSRCVMDEAAVRKHWREHGARVNTDDLPYVEFDSSTDQVRMCARTIHTLLPHFSSPWEHVTHLGVAEEDVPVLRQELDREAAAFRLSIEAATASAENRLEQAFEFLDAAEEISPANRKVRFMRASMLGEQRMDILFGRSAEQHRRRAAEIALVIGEEEVRGDEGPGVPDRYLAVLRLRLARILLRLGDTAAAMRYVDDVLAADGTVPAAQHLRRQYGREPGGE